MMGRHRVDTESDKARIFLLPCNHASSRWNATRDVRSAWLGLIELLESAFPFDRLAGVERRLPIAGGMR